MRYNELTNEYIIERNGITLFLVEDEILAQKLDFICRSLILEKESSMDYHTVRKYIEKIAKGFL